MLRISHGYKAWLLKTLHGEGCPRFLPCQTSQTHFCYSVGHKGRRTAICCHHITICVFSKWFTFSFSATAVEWDFKNIWWFPVIAGTVFDHPVNTVFSASLSRFVLFSFLSTLLCKHQVSPGPEAAHHLWIITTFLPLSAHTLYCSGLQIQLHIYL